MSIEATDPVIFRADLMARLGIAGETLRRYMRDKKLPPPDVDMSQRKRGWRLSTLRKHGLNLPQESTP